MKFPAQAELAVRQRFAEAMSTDRPKKEVQDELGIAESTFYKWRQRWLQYGDAWVRGAPITKAVHLPMTTARTSRREILDLCLAMPTSSVRSIAKQLHSDRLVRIAPSTISNLLIKANLNTRQLRAEELHRRHLRGEKLSPIQRDLVRKSVDPTIAWKGDVATHPGRILAQGVVRTHRASPLGVTPLYVVVDTFDRLAFAMFPAERGPIGQIECLKQAIHEFGCDLKDVRAVFSDPGDEYMSCGEGSSYHRFLLNNKITHRSKRPFMAVWQVV